MVAATGEPARVAGLRPFPALQNGAIKVPATPTALWCWLRGDDAGDLWNAGRALEQALAPVAVCAAAFDTFRHGRGPNGHGLDLTGYEDGTENPKGKAALAAAFVRGVGAGIDGSSYVAVQQWQHDFARFDAMTSAQRDAVMGRRLGDNEEIEDAPESAHVKRTAQEDFVPEAFVLRRSMPWTLGRDAGLMFVAFGATLNAFEAQMRRMAGLDDGVVDGLFGMSQPLTGAYFWCPPMLAGHLDLRAFAAP